MVGRTIGHYQVLEKIGEGGMGVVYKARDTTLGRFVALKAVAPDRVVDLERKQRFMQEAKAASALKHPNIVTIHDFIHEGGVDFIVMEHVEGPTLDEIIPKRGLRLKEALGYAIPIADALARAHAAGIVHRDLKPSNVMVDVHGQVKVLDFGLAKLTGPIPVGESATTLGAGAQPRTGEGRIVGTVAYMSPEQAEGKEVDARSDIFSFGSMLYEMMTGTRAFQGDTTAATLSAVIDRDPKPLSEIVTDLPRDLERIVLRCLRKDPARRFQAMADLKVELEDLKIESDSQALAARPPVRTRRRPSWLVVTALVAPLLAFAGWYALRQRPAPLPAAVVIPLTSYPGTEGSPSFSPDGSQVAFHWNGERRDNWDIYVKLVGAVTPLRLTTDPGRDVNPVWSPDGRHIAFLRFRAGGPNVAGQYTGGREQASVYLISPLGGPERKAADCRPARLPALAWSPDGNWLAVAELELEGSNGISLIPVERGEKRRLTRNTVDVDNCPSFSPDGRSLAYASCAAYVSCDVRLLDLGPDYQPRGEPRTVVTTSFTQGIAWARDGRSVVYAQPDITPYLWRASVSGSASPVRLEVAGPQARYPAISPVAHRLAFSRGVVDEDIWRFEVGGTPEAFIASTRDDRNPRFSSDGAKIVFSSSRSGEMEIWTCDRDGSNAVQLTDRLGRFQAAPRWSPDDRWIAFSSLAETGKRSVYLVDAAGGQPRRLTSPDQDEHDPSWSRDGRWIYFTSHRSGRAEIWRMLASGGESTRITDNGGYVAAESRDGQLLYYVKTATALTQPLFAKPLAGGLERQVLDAISGRGWVAAEDGIYHFGPPDAQGAYPLRFFDIATGETRVLTTIASAPGIGLTVSPDRRTFLFSTTKPVDHDLMLIENFR